MLKEGLKRFLHVTYGLLSFDTRRRLAVSLLDSIARSSCQDETARETAYRSLDLALVELEDRIRHLRCSGRRVSSSRSIPIVTSVIEDKAPWREIPIEPFAMPGMPPI